MEQLLTHIQPQIDLSRLAHVGLCTVLAKASGIDNAGHKPAALLLLLVELAWDVVLQQLSSQNPSSYRGTTELLRPHPRYQGL